MGKTPLKLYIPNKETKKGKRVTRSIEPVNGICNLQTSLNPGNLTLSKLLGDAIYHQPQVSQYIFAEHVTL